MSINLKNNLKATARDGLITLTNISSEPLINIKLTLENLDTPITEYKVVRERGSLTFSSPLEQIELGNLFPDESAQLYFKLDSTESTISFEDIPLQAIQISFSQEDCEPIQSDLNTFL